MNIAFAYSSWSVDKQQDRSRKVYNSSVNNKNARSNLYLVLEQQVSGFRKYATACDLTRFCVQLAVPTYAACAQWQLVRT